MSRTVDFLGPGFDSPQLHYGIYMIKECLICHKPFETTKYGEGRKYCFECSPSYQKGDNKGRSIAITAIRHAIKKELVRYKGGRCEICGYDKCVGALQFHHLDPTQKDFTPSEKYNGGKINMEELYSEVDKCQLLCANCHAEKHFNLDQ